MGEEVQRRSRRTLLTAGLGSIAALAAGALGRVPGARAGAGSEGDTIVVGGEYSNARTPTYILNQNNANVVLAAQSVAGGVALSGESDENTGVLGRSTYGSGVEGKSTRGQYGVYGEAPVSGVYGLGSRYSGVDGTGVTGYSPTGYGVYGRSDSGAAVFAVGFAGHALVARGRVSFSKAGNVAIPVGKRVTTVAPSGGMNGASQIHCTLESNQPGLSLQHVTRNVSAKNFTITLSSTVTSGRYAKVGWIVFDPD